MSCHSLYAKTEDYVHKASSSTDSQKMIRRDASSDIKVHLMWSWLPHVLAHNYVITKPSVNITTGFGRRAFLVITSLLIVICFMLSFNIAPVILVISYITTLTLCHSLFHKQEPVQVGEEVRKSFSSINKLHYHSNNNSEIEILKV